ncbi:MAG: putative iron-regulated membrane protein [Colwellia sp.]|jgi:uncharacterized iron-regulated membrane protein
MKPDFRRSMIWLHTYSGLMIGWLLFTIFLTGTLSYFNPEITQWMKPELVHVSSSDNMIDRSITELHKKGIDADIWRIYLPDNRTQHWTIQWSDGKKRQNLSLGPKEGEVVTPRESAGGNFFRVFHYTLQLRRYGGRYIAGIAAMFMIVAIFSGIFTHRRFFRDFFTLRLSKLSKTLTDFHAIAGVVTIPFCLMICTSGIMIYVIMFMPFSAEKYADGARKLSQTLSPGLVEINKNAKKESPISDFYVVQRQIKAQWPGEKQIRRITFEQPFSQDGRIIVDRIKDLTVSRQSDRLVFSSHTGEALTGYPQVSTATQVRRVFFGLHEAHFADIGLRWLLFLLGLLSTALIATGLIIWLNKRLDKVKQRHIGHFIVERLNIATIIGLPLAIITYFMSNRLLSIDIENRASAEIQVFLLAWIVCFLHSFLRPARKAWIEQLLIGALACYLLPIIDLYQDSQRMKDAIINANYTYLTFNVFILLTGVALMKIALWLSAKNPNLYLSKTKANKLC